MLCRMEKKLTSCEGAFGAVLEQEGHLGPRTLVLKKVCWLPRSMNDNVGVTYWLLVQHYEEDQWVRHLMSDFVKQLS